VSPIKNIVVISDTHCGCQTGLCPSSVTLDDGGTYHASKFQQSVWNWWEEFWDWVKTITKNAPFDLVMNGDALDGNHHQATSQITHNLKDQLNIAYAVLAPVVKKARKYYHIRGTEAHVGPSAHLEETLAQRLNAIPNEIGQHARYDLWKYLGDKKILCHFAHHIGTTGSQAYESTAVFKELVEAYVEAGRWDNRPPDVVVRSHRHRAIMVEAPSSNAAGISVVTPAWQGKTPFVWKIPGGRQSQPQFGGVLLREAPDGVWYVRPWVKSLSRPEPEE